MFKPAGPLTTLEKVNIGLAMTWAAGFVDLVGYVSLYGLYTSHMTGNTVAMARHISELQWSGVVRRGWPILMFVFGLMLGALIYEAEKRPKIQIPFPPAIGLEVLLIGIFIAAAMGNGFKADIPPQPAGKFFLMVALLAIPMGIQNVFIRGVGGLNVYTTFVTGSLVIFAENLAQYLFWLQSHPESAPDFASHAPLPTSRTNTWRVDGLSRRRSLRRFFNPTMGAAWNICSVRTAPCARILRGGSNFPPTLER